MTSRFIRKGLARLPYLYIRSFLLANSVGLFTICQDHSVQISSFKIFDRIFSTLFLPLLLLVNLDANKSGKEQNDTKIDEDAADAEEKEEEERKG